MNSVVLRSLLLTILCCPLFSAFAEAAPYNQIPTGVKNFGVEGILFASWSKGEYGTPEADQSLVKLMQTGADYVGILATWYMNTTDQEAERTTSNRIYDHPEKTVLDDDLIHVITVAKAHGRKVFLKLHVRVILSADPWSDCWAGDINPSDPQEWFSYYTRFAEYYAQLCETYHVDLFCFGSELNTMTTSAYAASWDSVINAIKTYYAGNLTFSANFYGEYKQIPFWHRCDYLGIGPYFSLTHNIPNPDLDMIVDGWFDSPIDGALIQDMEDWSAQHDKKVIFTEIGYCSVDTAPFQPWKGTQDLPENWPLHRRCYDAPLLALQNRPWFAGLFWWDWLCDPNAGMIGPTRREYTPQNKDAEHSLRNFYMGIETADVAYIRIVDAYDVEIPDGTAIGEGIHKNLFARAYASTGQMLGYAPCRWSASPSGTITLESSQVGFSRLTTLREGTLTITASLDGGPTDTVVLIIAHRYRRVPSEYPTINAAMNAASDGDVVVVAEGQYNEGPIYIKEGVSLMGETCNPLNTTILGGVLLPNNASNHMVISGFTITNREGHGIVGMDPFEAVGSPIIKNNIITGNRYRGIFVYESSPIIGNNIIVANAGGGIYLDRGVPHVINNVIADNTAEQGGGIFVQHTEAKIFNNIIMSNRATHYGAGIKCWYNAADFEIGYNDVWNNSARIAEHDYGTCTSATGNISQDPLFSNTNYHLAAGSPCIDTGHPDEQYNDILDGTRNDMGIYGGPTPLGSFTVILPCNTLSASAMPESGGAVKVNTPENCSRGYVAGTEISLTATRATNYVFIGWTASGGVFSNPSSADTTFTITSNASITANFWLARLGDFDRDSKCDILWHHTVSGQVKLFFMDGSVIKREAEVATIPDRAWGIAGTGDYNGDGKADILWHNKTSGEVYLWLMSGGTVLSQIPVARVPDPSWAIVGTGDYNGDGRADILWHNKSSGEVYLWLVSSGTILWLGRVGTVVDTSWGIVGTGDYSGDGKADILWYNKSSGEVYLWLMSDGTILSQIRVTRVADTSWRIVGTADYNGDGKADILWHNRSSGDVYLYLMDGGTTLSVSLIARIADTSWEIVGSGDYNGDGKADILWRNKSSGEIYMYLMNGLQITWVGPVGIVADLNWQIIRVP